MLKIALTASAVYLAAIGISLMLAPLQFGVGAVPANAPSELMALLRLLGGPFLGIAALNWLSRSEDRSQLKAVLIANLVGFGSVAANDLVGIATGASRDLAKLFVFFHLIFAAAFLYALLRGRRAPQEVV